MRLRAAIFLSLCTLGTISSEVMAADVSRPILKAPVAPVHGYGWSGLYAGGNAGIGAAGTRAEAFGNNLSNDAGDAVDLFRSGFSGGAQMGYNFHFWPNVVLGVEGDIGTLRTKRIVCISQNCSPANNLTQLSSATSTFSTLRGRVGYASDRFLIYGTAGAAWVKVKDDWTDIAAANELRERTQTLSGWTAGGGLEVALAGNWTAKAEYLYVNAGKLTVTDPTDNAYIDYTHRYHVARLGLNYRLFGTSGATAPAVATQAFNWTGFYVGANLGAGAARTTGVITDPFLEGIWDHYKAGVTGGGQIGYNWQVAPNVVLGVEADLGVLDTARSFCLIGNNCAGAFRFVPSSETDFTGTLRARAGFAWDRSLLYVTGGAAWARVTDSWTDNTSLNSRTKTLSGWTLGGGLETALAGNWTLKTEYIFVDVGHLRIADADGIGNPGVTLVDFKHQYHVARLGLNYKFGAEPAASK